MSVIILLFIVLNVICAIVLICMLCAASTNDTNKLEQSLDMQEVLNDFNETIREHQKYIYSKFERTLEDIKNQSSSTSHKH